MTKMNLMAQMRAEQVEREAATKIKVGQHWQEVDPRFDNLPIREVVEISKPFGLLCRGAKVIDAQLVTLRAVDGGRKSIAKTHNTNGKPRFNGKRGGYKLVKDVE